MVFSNFSFFDKVIASYPISFANIFFLLSLVVVFTSANVLLLALLALPRCLKPVLILIVIVSSFSAYFMDTYHIIIDDVMVDNILKTDRHEAFDLVSIKLFVYLFFLGILPSIFILKIKIEKKPLATAFFSRLGLIAVAILIPAIIMVSMSAHYSSFIREHKILRSYANPSYALYSGYKYLRQQLKSSNTEFTQLGTDAHTPPTDVERELIVLVIGETARADHFSLNGYERKTNPLLEKEDVISFDNVWACGTSTSVSVPCLFSINTRKEYKNEDAIDLENALDIIQRSGANVLWIDNNSDSKGVANRVSYSDYKREDCDGECRDAGMLEQIPDYIKGHPEGDIFIILHQMGSHGPAYYKRYPKAFDVFQPSCQTNLLEDCSIAEITNAYDNTILYTDYFLSEAIDLLKAYPSFESVLLYVSDHGESLGENGVYLHGLPYLIAPDAQKHVPMIIWIGDLMRQSDINFSDLKARKHDKFTHDNMFHTLLGFLEVDSDIYDESKDIIRHLTED